MICKCGEHMEGDGFTVVIHCASVEIQDYQHLEPDADPVYCTFTEGEEGTHEIPHPLHGK